MFSIKRTVGSLAIVGTLFFAGVGCGSSSSQASFCDQAKKVDANDLGPADGKKFTDMLEKLQSKAPSEIKGDMATLVNAFTAMQKDPTKMPENLDEKKIEKASANIEAYLKDKCGIDSSS